MQDLMEKPEFNVAIALSSVIDVLVRKLNHTIAQLGNIAYTFGPRATPHITLYSVEYPPEMHSEVVETFRTFVRTTHPFDIVLRRVVNYGKYVEIIVDPTPLITQLHYRVMETFNPLRKGYIRPRYLDPLFLRDYPEGEHTSIETWGRPIVGHYYVPHISVGRLLSEERIPPDLLKWEPLTMRVDRLLLGRGGKWGVIQEVVEEIYAPT